MDRWTTGLPTLLGELLVRIVSHTQGMGRRGRTEGRRHSRLLRSSGHAWEAHPCSCSEQTMETTQISFHSLTTSSRPFLCECGVSRACVCALSLAVQHSVLFATKLGFQPPPVKKMTRPTLHESRGEKSLQLQVQISVVWRNSKSASQQQRIIFTTLTVLLRLVLPVFNLPFLVLERNTQ